MDVFIPERFQEFFAPAIVQERVVVGELKVRATHVASGGTDFGQHQRDRFLVELRGDPKAGGAELAGPRATPRGLDRHPVILAPGQEIESWHDVTPGTEHAVRQSAIHAIQRALFGVSNDLRPCFLRAESDDRVCVIKRLVRQRRNMQPAHHNARASGTKQVRDGVGFIDLRGQGGDSDKIEFRKVGSGTEVGDFNIGDFVSRWSKSGYREQAKARQRRDDFSAPDESGQCHAEARKLGRFHPHTAHCDQADSHGYIAGSWLVAVTPIRCNTCTTFHVANGLGITHKEAAYEQCVHGADGPGLDVTPEFFIAAFTGSFCGTASEFSTEFKFGKHADDLAAATREVYVPPVATAITHHQIDWS